MTEFREKIRQQLDLEDEARALGAARYRGRKALPWKTEVGSIEEEANLPPGKRLMKAAIEPTASAITEFLDDCNSGKAGRKHVASHFMLLAEPEELAYLTARVLVNSCQNDDTTLQNCAIILANVVIEHISLTVFRSRNKAGYHGLIQAQKKRGYSRNMQSAVRKLLKNEEAFLETSSQDRLLLGGKLIELLIESTGLFTTERVHRVRGPVYVIRPTEAVMRWLDEQHARCELLDPITMPMVVRPRRWRSPFYGGFLTKRPGQKLVKQRQSTYHEELRNGDIAHVYVAINHIQETPWRINRRVLEVVDEVVLSGGLLGGLPAGASEPLPTKPGDLDTNEEALRAWKREAAQTHQRNARSISARLAMHQRLWMARKFANEERIFFPHEMDFRGRVYPICVQAPNPQGDDLSKALIEFADGKPLGLAGMRWLAIHIANLFGVDKVSFDERIKWTYDNAAALIDSAIAPLDGDRFWTTADSPFMALAACFEFVGMLEEKEAFVSHLPIALDGSNSGLQHFSAMLRDPEGARAVNLAPSKEPQDIYAEVASEATDMVEGSDDPAALPWRGGKITRAITKRPCMTFCYSATRFGMQDMILQTLREVDKDNTAAGKPPHLEGADNYEAAMFLSHILYDAIRMKVSAAARAMDWLRSVAAIAAEANQPLWWTTPMGLPVLQSYQVAHGKRVTVHWCGSSVKLMLNLDTATVDKRAQRNGVAPNFVHSLDASHLQAVAKRCKEVGIDHLAVIHDSFGTHAADTDRLAAIIRETFVEQYTPDVLSALREEIGEQLPDDLRDKLPLPPAAGQFDLNQVLGSAYVFA